MNALIAIDNALASKWVLLGVIVFMCVLPLAMCKWYERRLS